MKKRVLSLLVLVTLLLGVFTACGNNDVLTPEQAQKIAVEDAGFTVKQATDIHTHIVTEEGVPCFSVHFSAGGKDFSYVISAADGTILSGGEGSGH